MIQSSHSGLLALAFLTLGATVAAAAEVTVYVGTYTDGTSKGIYRFSLDLETGKASAPALAGVRRSGDQRYLLPPDRAKKVVLGPATFVVADACSLARNDLITGTPGTRTRALLALHGHLRNNPADAKRFTIVPLSASRAA